MREAVAVRPPGALDVQAEVHAPLMLAQPPPQLEFK